MKKVCKLFYCILLLMYTSAQTKNAVVIGASIGMGRELAKTLADNGYTVSMTARRETALEKLQQEIPTQTYYRYMDASKPDEAVATLHDMITELGGLDLLVIAVTGWHECNFASKDWHDSKMVIDVDVAGFFALAHAGLRYFEQQGHGHLVGFTSIDGLHGAATHPAYSAAKAFCSRYLEAERNYFKQKNIPITVTDIIPGWVDSHKNVDYAQVPSAYWVETLEDATREIFEAIQNRVDVAYITKRQQKVAELLRFIDGDLYNALNARPGGKL